MQGVTGERRHGAGKRSADGSDNTAASGRAWRLLQRPGVTLVDVIGMHDLKSLVQNKVVGPLRDPAVSTFFGERPGGGLLLYGPPGNGKTYFARALAGELDCALFVIRAPDVVSKWVGDTDKHIRAFMQQAKSQPRAMVFIDEIEALFPRRGSRSTIANRAVSTFLEELDGFDQQSGLLLIVGATNLPDQLDGALVRSVAWCLGAGD